MSTERWRAASRLTPPPNVSARAVDDCVAALGGMTTGILPATEAGPAIVKRSFKLATPPPPTTYGLTRVVSVGRSIRAFVVKMVARPPLPETDPFEAGNLDWSSEATSGFNAGTNVTSTPIPAT